jgi:hypothetical protein
VFAVFPAMPGFPYVPRCVGGTAVKRDGRGAVGSPGAIPALPDAAAGFMKDFAPIAGGVPAIPGRAYVF